MADEELQGKPLSEFGRPSAINEDTLFFASAPSAITPGEYDTVGVSGGVLKNLFNEELYTDFVQTLAIGETSITFSDNRILSTSTIDIYTDTFGVNPTEVNTSAGSVTLTFPAQEAAVAVKVRLWLSDKGANYNSPIKSVSWDGDGTEPRLIEIPLEDASHAFCLGIIPVDNGTVTTQLNFNGAIPFRWGDGTLVYTDNTSWKMHQVTYNAPNIMRITGYPNHVGQIFNWPGITYTLLYVLV